MFELESKISSYCDLLMERESEYRKAGDEKTANEILRIVTELSQILGYI